MLKLVRAAVTFSPRSQRTPTNPPIQTTKRLFSLLATSVLMFCLDLFCRSLCEGFSTSCKPFSSEGDVTWKSLLTGQYWLLEAPSFTFLVMRQVGWLLNWRLPSVVFWETSIFSKPNRRHASEVDRRLAIKFNDVNCEAGCVSTFSSGALCSLIFIFRQLC